MDMNTLKYQIMEECLNNNSFKTINDNIIKDACINLGIDKNYAELLFPNSIKDLLRFFSLTIDKRLEEKLKKLDLNQMKIREKIYTIVKLRIEEYKNYKLAIKELLFFLSKPLNIKNGALQLWSTCDNIWYLAGDNSTDFNFYTKRIILTGVYSSTLLYWLNDKSSNNIKTWDFLQGRIENVLKFGKLKSNLLKIKKVPFIRLMFH